MKEPARDIKNYRTDLSAALEDTFQRRALDKFAVDYRASRERIYSGLNDRELIAEVAARKDESVRHLDELFVQFKEEAEKRGVQVHLARDAADANRIIAKIAEDNGCKMAVKSKSMTVEEIQTNTALEAKGMEVVETDLAEWIIQLRHEGPSHMVMPAIHLFRTQVADTFTKETGKHQTEDITSLVRVARRELRRKFAEADMGISGMNFAVAESGAIGLVTNEGNARMVTTLPRVHVAVGGIDKLIPSFDDAMATLRVLPRNATGQHLTSYVTWIAGGVPTASAPDGKKSMHVVFVDNGRKAVLNDPILSQALRCVRCGACADKGHFFLGTNDPKNMPVLRAELLRSLYRRDYTKLGKILGKRAGARSWDKEVVKELFYYAYQCTECRRCSLFCPYGIDTAEITAIVRELLHEVGLGIHWIMDPVKNCSFTGNHLGIQPHSFVEIVEMLADDCETITGIRPKTPFNEKGHEILFITPSGDVFADPGIYTFMGYLMLFHELDLDYTFSTYASEGGNFGSFTTFNMAKKLNAKMYAEAERLGAKWILGGECGHMWRVINQYMATYNGPAPSCMMDVPTSPITGTKFTNAAATKMVHITEFTADLIKHNKLNLDPSRNDHIITTFHDSCNPARAMGMLEEPRAVLRAVCPEFVEMPPHTIREETFCCGSGSGLNTEEIMELRLRAGFPRGNALRYVQEKNGVNWMSCVCAIDRATLPPLANYWAPGVTVSGLHELVANALVMKGEQPRTMNLRQEDLECPDPEPEEEAVEELAASAEEDN